MIAELSPVHPISAKPIVKRARVNSIPRRIIVRLPPIHINLFVSRSLPGRFAGIRRPLHVCGDEMRHHRQLRANVERAGALFGGLIADGYALVLAQMLGPGSHTDTSNNSPASRQSKSYCCMSKAAASSRRSSRNALRASGDSVFPPRRSGTNESFIRTFPFFVLFVKVMCNLCAKIVYQEITTVNCENPAASSRQISF